MALHAIEDLKKRSCLVKKWAKRFEKLTDKKQMNRSDFCRKYEIHLAWLVRAEQMVNIPTWKSIKKIEDGLAAEGV